jgi:hypothetical protein
MRLFLHMPKCGGVSVKSLLETHLGSRLTLDYESYGALAPSSRESQIANVLHHPVSVGEGEIIYGHFYPVKYFGRAHHPNYKIVTILREPLERLISHYFYWKRTKHPSHYVYKKFETESWTLENFIMSEDLRNFYCQFFSFFPLQRFDYIGVYERLEWSVHQCLEALDLEIQFNALPHLNSSGDIQERRGLLSESFISEARDFHSKDYIIYNRIYNRSPVI